MGLSLKKIASAAITAAGNYFVPGSGDAVAGAVGLGQDQLAAEEQWKWQKKASDYAFNQNLQMWNLQNAYNDPSAQMERLKAAGLNPNLVYGGGNVSGNTAGSGPTYERPNVNFQDKSVQREQLALAMQEFRQRVTNQAIENDMARQRLVLNEREADRLDRLADSQINAYAHNIGLTDARIGDIYFDQKHYVAPDRRGWATKHIDDFVGPNIREQISNAIDNLNNYSYKAYNSYKNSWFHKMLRR